MDKIILTIDQQEIDPSTNTDGRDNYRIRNAVRAVMCDSDGRVALMYVGRDDYYKLPGGGVEDGEDLDIALARELLEETGSKASIVESLGEIIEWRDFAKMKQISYAFRVTLDGEVGSPDFTQGEIELGFELRWIDNLDKAIELVETASSSKDPGIMFMSKRDAAILQAAK